MFEITEVPPDASELPEALGTKPKFWYQNNFGEFLLYKQGRPDTGEHWAEKVSCEIAALLGLPHAHYELAHWKGRNGVVSPTFVPSGGRLILGNELIAKLVHSEYALHAKRFQAKQHTVRTVMGLLRASWIAPPIGFQLPVELRNVQDIFVGYLLLDAFIGNQDRHHENWGLILQLSSQSANPIITLAPTYDHASSLGRNERDEERLRRLRTRDRGSSLEHYVQRAESAFFLNPNTARPLSTIAAFQEAARIAPRAADYWLGCLDGVTLEKCRDVVASVPQQEMSPAAREFALRMLRLNQERLLQNR